MDARSIIENALPNANERFVVLRQLLDTANFAHLIDPAGWAVTLKDGGFRLNVARVEALTFWDDYLRVLIASPNHPITFGENVREMAYKSVPISHSVFEGSVAEFLRAKDKLRAPHQEYVRAALTSTEGGTKRTNHRKTHSADLIQYAEEQLSKADRYFVLMWNPIAERTTPGLMEGLFSGELTDCHWTCGKRRDIAPGDHVFMRRTRRAKGLIGYGDVLGGYVDGPNPMVFVRWRHISEHEFIRDDDPDFMDVEKLWTSQSGGAEISQDSAERILHRLREGNVGRSDESNKNFREGRSSSVLLTKYEASSAARRACLQYYHYKFECEICRFSFAEKYGADLGAEYIHVHHINPRSCGERETNPITDLIPVCPNCHAMLHQSDPPLHPDELRRRLGAKDCHD